MDVDRQTFATIWLVLVLTFDLDCEFITYRKQVGVICIHYVMLWSCGRRGGYRDGENDEEHERRGGREGEGKKLRDQ